MLVLDLFRRLSFGEFSNLSIGVDGAGHIKESEYAKLISYTNEALLKLYSRFILSEKTVVIEAVEGVTNYHLKRKFADSSGSDELYRYIKDLPAEPFEEDVLRVLQVYNGFGNKMVLNDSGNPRSLFTPESEIIQIPNAIDGSAFSITYQARHKELVDIGDNILNQYINIPDSLETALQNYVASKLYSHMNGQEHVAKSIEYMNSYELICREIEMKDLVNNSWSDTTSKLEDRGFV